MERLPNFLSKVVAETASTGAFNVIDLAPIVRPILVAWRQLREQTAAFDKATPLG